MPGLTLIEKIATLYAVGLASGQVARRADFINIRPRHVMTNDNSSMVIAKFREIGAAKIADRRQPVLATDHDIQNRSPENLAKYARTAQFAADQGIDFYPAGAGIAHQIMVEQGYIRPGTLVVGSDSHSNLYGALGALGTAVVRTDAARIWATGITWWQVPPVARVTLRGHLPKDVSGKDVIIALCGSVRHGEVLNHAIEFTGAGVADLTIEQRMTIANMTTEWDALAGVFPFDERLRDFLHARAEILAQAASVGMRRANLPYTCDDVENWWQRHHADAASPFSADPDACYDVEIELDLATVTPHVCGPNDVRTIVPLPEIEARRIKIDKAWLLSCVNGRYEDIATAAQVFGAKKVAAGVEFYVAAASAEVQAQAERAGHWQVLMAAGAIALPPGCATCVGLGRGTIKAGETGISASNRNYAGRMGDRDATVYLGSPAVVAASAVAGYICAPRRQQTLQPNITVRYPQRGAENNGSPIHVSAGFPERIRGRLLFLDCDHLTTDAIFAAKHVYRDAMDEREMAAVLFENYDSKLIRTAARGDIIVSGCDFGAGSSREQAATALKHFGFPCVIAASFGDIYKRNAFNNGLPLIECPALAAHLRAMGLPKRPFIHAGEIAIDYRRSQIDFDNVTFGFSPLNPVAQELIVAGGALEIARCALQP